MEDVEVGVVLPYCVALCGVRTLNLARPAPVHMAHHIAVLLAPPLPPRPWSRRGCQEDRQHTRELLS